jgi:hypothetical protein
MIAYGSDEKVKVKVIGVRGEVGGERCSMEQCDVVRSVRNNLLSSICKASVEGDRDGMLLLLRATMTQT